MRNINFKYFKRYIKKYRKSKVPAFIGYRKKYSKNNLVNKFKKIETCPQKSGMVQKIFITTPRKPNSAKRQTAKVNLSNGKKIIVFLCGIGHNLSIHSEVIICGGGAKDLPGVNYKAVRGLKDFDRLYKRRNARSKYGAIKPK